MMTCSRSGPTETISIGLADELAEALDVALGVRRQLVEAAGAGAVGLPAGQLFVLGLGAVEGADAGRRRVHDLAVDLVGRADLDRREGVQHVEPRERN